MKKIIYLFILSLCVYQAKSQSIPNGSFETWSSGAPSLPMEWKTAGLLAKISSITINTVTKFPSHQSLCIGLGNAVIGTTGIIGQVYQKFPMITRPKSIRFDCMYFPNTSTPGQTAGVQVIMTKWNGTSHDTIANGTIALNGAAIIDWASVAIDLAPFYKSGVTANPDSCFVRFRLFPNSSGQVTANALMFLLDAAKFSANAASVEETIISLGKPSQLEIFPNPAKEKAILSFTLKCNSKVKVDIMDLNGRIVKEQEPIDTFSGTNKLVLDIEGLDEGLYIVRLSSEFGVNSTKLIIGQ